MGPTRYIVFFSFLQSLAFAQGGVLKGAVILNEVGGTPVVGVSVSADGANDTATGAGGKFRLQFPYKKVGDPVEVRVSRPGYVVVNWVQQKLNLPGGNSEELTLIICKESEREVWARSFYRLKGIDAVEASYQRRLHELEESNRENAAEVAKLQQERDQARAAAGEASAGFARVKPGDATDLYAQAMSLFVQGKVAEALKVLDEQKLDAEMAGAQKKEEEARAERARAVHEYLLRAELLTTQYRFDEAERLYASLAERFPDNFDVQFAYGYYSLGMNHFAAARDSYDRALAIARQDHNEALVAVVLNNLGFLDIAQNRLDEARAHYEEALKIRRQLADKNPDAYLPYVATTLNNLGNLDSAQNRLDEARAHHEEALKIRRQLANKNPDVYLPDLAMTLNNLGNLDSFRNRLGEARAHYEEALKVYRELAEKNPDAFLSDVATTLNNLGNLDSAQNRLGEARAHYEEALKVCRELAEKNADAFLSDVAATLNNLGILDRAQNRLDEARAHYAEALKIRRQLANKNPDAYMPDVAGALNNLGNLDRDQNRLDEAREHIEEALKIRRQLANMNPDAYMPDVALTLYNLGLLDRRQNRLDQARAHLSESLAIFSTLAANDPGRFSVKRDVVAKELASIH